MTEPRRRATDTRGWHALVRENWYRDVWLAIITATVVFALVLFEHESHVRRDQTCKIFEKDEQNARNRLTGTYTYLSGLTPRELRQPLNVAVLVQLPQTERDAQSAVAPPYCDAPGVGLPEPKVKQPLPQRPAWLDALIRRQIRKSRP